jgi:hypothetical protein
MNKVKKRKQGRPKLPAGEVRSVRIPVRIKPEEDARLKAEAEKAGVKYTDLLRSKILS